MVGVAELIFSVLRPGNLAVADYLTVTVWGDSEL